MPDVGMGIAVTHSDNGEVRLDIVDVQNTLVGYIKYTPEQAVQLATLLCKHAGRAVSKQILEAKNA